MGEPKNQQQPRDHSSNSSSKDRNVKDQQGLRQDKRQVWEDRDGGTGVHAEFTVSGTQQEGFSRFKVLLHTAGDSHRFSSTGICTLSANLRSPYRHTPTSTLKQCLRVQFRDGSILRYLGP